MAATGPLVPTLRVGPGNTQVCVEPLKLTVNKIDLVIRLLDAVPLARVSDKYHFDPS